jgi:hypothetical protein
MIAILALISAAIAQSCTGLKLQLQNQYNNACGGAKECADGCYDAIPKIMSKSNAQRLYDICNLSYDETVGYMDQFQQLKATKLARCGRAVDYNITINDIKLRQSKRRR